MRPRRRNSILSTDPAAFRRVSRTGFLALVVATGCSGSSHRAATVTASTAGRAAEDASCYAPPTLPLGWMVEELTGAAPIGGGLLAMSNSDLSVTVIVQSGPSDEPFTPDTSTPTAPIHGTTAAVEVLADGEPPQSTVTWTEAGQLITVIDQRTPPLDAAAAVAEASRLELRPGGVAALDLPGFRTAVRMGPTDGPACELILRNDTVSAVITTLRLGKGAAYDVRGLGRTDARVVNKRTVLVGTDALDPAGKRTVAYEVPGGIVLVEGDAGELDDLIAIAADVAPSRLSEVSARFKTAVTPTQS